MGTHKDLQLLTLHRTTKKLNHVPDSIGQMCLGIPVLGDACGDTGTTGASTGALSVPTPLSLGTLGPPPIAFSLQRLQSLANMGDPCHPYLGADILFPIWGGILSPPWGFQDPQCPHHRVPTG